MCQCHASGSVKCRVVDSSEMIVCIMSYISVRSPFIAVNNWIHVSSFFSIIGRRQCPAISIDPIAGVVLVSAKQKNLDLILRGPFFEGVLVDVKSMLRRFELLSQVHKVL